MEKICKNCSKHWFECPRLIIDDMGCGYTNVLMTPNDDTCEAFDPIQENDKEQK